MSTRTSVVVAHRLTTVRNANIFYVFDTGEIKKQGTHDDLIAKHGVYYELVKRQLKENENQEHMEEMKRRSTTLGIDNGDDGDDNDVKHVKKSSKKKDNIKRKVLNHPNLLRRNLRMKPKKLKMVIFIPSLTIPFKISKRKSYFIFTYIFQVQNDVFHLIDVDIAIDKDK